MKLTTAAMILSTLFPAVALATGSPSNSNGPRKGGDSTSNSTAISGAVSNSKADARAASTSKSSSKSKSKSSATGGNAAAAGGAGGNSAGGSAVASVAPMSFSFTAPATPSASFVQYDYSGMPNNTPAMGNTYVNSSNGCDGAVGASLVLPGFGGSLSASTLRMMCEGRLNAQAHKSLGQDEKAKLTMVVVQEYACEEDPKWAKIARKMGLCAPDEIAAAATQTNPAFQSN